MKHSFIFVEYPVKSYDDIIGWVEAPVDALEESARQLNLDCSNFSSVTTNDTGTITIVSVYNSREEY